MDGNMDNLCFYSYIFIWIYSIYRNKEMGLRNISTNSNKLCALLLRNDVYYPSRNRSMFSPVLIQEARQARTHIQLSSYCKWRAILTAIPNLGSSKNWAYVPPLYKRFYLGKCCQNSFCTENNVAGHCCFNRQPNLFYKEESRLHYIW